MRIRSVHGDITSKDSVPPFDLVLFSTKSYHLQEAIKDVKLFIGENTVALPLLNRIAHVSVLKKELGEEKIIGGSHNTSK